MTFFTCGLTIMKHETVQVDSSVFLYLFSRNITWDVFNFPLTTSLIGWLRTRVDCSSRLAFPLFCLQTSTSIGPRPRRVRVVRTKSSFPAEGLQQRFQPEEQAAEASTNAASCQGSQVYCLCRSKKNPRELHLIPNDRDRSQDSFASIC